MFLFGSRGHLARTKIIPALESTSTNYIPMSRSRIINISKYSKQKNIFYMSVPSQSIFECIEPYHDFVLENRPTFVVEKPHGINEINFNVLKNFFSDNHILALYNDHYIAKVPDKLPVKGYKPNKIEIIIHERNGVDDRMTYFDNVGIIFDMYQSHVVVLLSIVLSECLEQSKTEILEGLSEIQPLIMDTSQYIGYSGKAPTYCKIYLKYNDIEIIASCGKKMPENIKEIYIDDKIIELDNKSNPYEKVVNWLNDEDYSNFLSSYQVDLLWKHISWLPK